MPTYEVLNQPIHTADQTYYPGDTVEDPEQSVVNAFADNLEEAEAAGDSA